MLSEKVVLVEIPFVQLEDGTVEKIKSCPFCGSKDAYIQQNKGKSQIRCWWDLTCKYRSGWFSSLAEAVKEWNS